MKYLIALILFISPMAIAQEQLDFSALQNAWPQQQQQQRPKQTDWKCMQDCQSYGYQYQYCLNRCSF